MTVTQLRQVFVPALFVLILAAPLAAQVPPDLTADRTDFTRWLLSSPDSPLAAKARQPIDTAVSLGPASADIPLAGLMAVHTLRRSASGAITLESDAGSRAVPRGRLVPVGNYRLRVSGTAERPVVTVFRDIDRAARPPAFFPYDPALVITRPLDPPASGGRAPLLASDGSEVIAAEAGTVTLTVGGRTATLRVRRIPVTGTDEAELELYFRDATNGRETYPAGRFVTLTPVGNGQVRIDFNRARNPFCAYNGVYPCPLPWPGNTIPAPVRAGEKYVGGGLSEPAVPTP